LQLSIYYISVYHGTGSEGEASLVDAHFNMEIKLLFIVTKEKIIVYLKSS